VFLSCPGKASTDLLEASVFARRNLTQSQKRIEELYSKMEI
jgi:hypothetical protein